MHDSTTDKPPARRKSLHPLLHLLVAVALLALVQGFIVKMYAIPSESMEPTLIEGDRILVNRLAFINSTPESGDVIVFTADEAWGPSPIAGDSAIKIGLKWAGSLLGIGPGVDHAMTKRVLAVGGQTIECCSADGKILVDGVPQPDTPGPDFEFAPSIVDCASNPPSGRCFPPLIVPDSEIVVVGDNRTNSRDSLTQCRDVTAMESCLLTVSERDVVGEVVMILFPVSRFGSL